MTLSFRSGMWPLAATFALMAATASAQSAPGTADELSLESLMEMRITSVSREEEDFLRTPAAVFVITQQDIRRSGVTDIAELLRSVPGLNVAQVNSSTWAISARGFNAQFATKLLVLVDGRSVYDPSFSGVFWHLENLPLDDIDRIEVIRGPGATMWGANAVNGVISITTKRAAQTPGGAVRAEIGSGRPGDVSLRFGGAMGTRGAYRVFARQTTRSALETPTGEDGGDPWNLTNAGFRIDWDASRRDSLTVQGGGYGGGAGNRQLVLTSMAPLAFGPAGWTSNHGANVLARWTRTLAPRSELVLQTYYDGRRVRGYGAKQVDTVDLDLQHSFALGARHHVTWGSGYRQVGEAFENSLSFGILPESQTLRLGSAFVQDQVTLRPERLFVTAGTKVERSSATGANVQPAVRVVVQPTERQSWWAATSRAVRTANRVERGMYLNVGGFETPQGLVLLQMLGRADATAEVLLAHEMGYRYQPRRRIWFDVAAFYNVYDDLSAVEPGVPFLELAAPRPHFVLPLFFTNTMSGATYGVETSAQYQVHDALTLKGNYSHLRMDLREPTDQALAETEEGRSPRHRTYVGATLRLPSAVELSGDVYVTGAVPSFAVPGYTRVDLNLAWKARDPLRLRIVGQNLLGSHIEHGTLPTPSNAMRRAVHGEVAVAF